MQKKDKEALAEFEKTLSLDSNFIDALSQIAEIHLAKGQAEKALERCNAQLKIVPNNPVIYNLLGRIYFVEKKDDKAEEYFKKSIELDKNFLPSYMDLGSVYAKSNSYDKAIQQYEDVLKANPKLLPPYMLLGVIYEKQEKYDKAKENYEKALKIDPKFAPAANNLAWNYAERGGDIDIALSLAQSAKEQLPDDPSISDTLGWIYYKKNAYLKAIGLLKESAEKLQGNPVIHYHLGMAYFKNGQKELAKKELNQALTLSQDFPGSEEIKKTLKEL
jgi:tetratricopeptide (TPR) repeat protein